MSEAATQTENATMNTAQLSKEVRELRAANATMMDAVDAALETAGAAAAKTGATVKPEPKGKVLSGENKGEPRLTAFQWSGYKVRQTGNTTVQVRHLVEIGAFIGAYRGLARLLESRVTLPVGIYADIIAGTVGLVLCEGVIYWRRR